VNHLIVIVDPNYAEHLEKASQNAPVWIVSTQANRNACARLWKLHPIHDHRNKGAITHYDSTNPEDRVGNLLDILPQLETHHGEVEGNFLVFPTGFVLEVIGLTLVDSVENALLEFGFTSFVETPEGFKARK
jgi:hypothetical protein